MSLNIFITGVAGLVGANMVEFLLKNKERLGIKKIYGVDNMSGGYVENLPLKIDEKGQIISTRDDFYFLKTDLTVKEDQKLIEEKIFKNIEGKVDYIYHFAAYASEGLSPFIRQFNYTNNLIPTVFLINMGIKYDIKRFIFTSSMGSYGRNSDGRDHIMPYTEDMNKNPIDSYGIAKYACEMDLKVAYEQHKMEYCIILPHNIYGKYQNIYDRYRNVLGIWMLQSLQGKPLTIYGDGHQSRSFSYIDDILEPLWAAAVSPKAKNEMINLGGKKHVSLNEACQMVSEITGNKDIVHLEPRHEIKHAWCSYEKSEEILNYKENITMREGLEKMWEWAKLQPEREQFSWSEYELDKGIYSYWK